MNRLFPYVAALAVVFLLAGCGSKKRRVVTFDPNFSVNVMPVPPDWPLEDKDWSPDPLVALAQQQIYQTNGAPDYFRLRWRKDGRLMKHQELFRKMWNDRHNVRKSKEYAAQSNVETEWVYLDDNAVYRFQRGKQPERRDLEDWIRVVTEYGDPSEITESVDVTGSPNLIFTYYEEGKIYYFRDGKQYKVDNQPAMPGWNTRR